MYFMTFFLDGENCFQSAKMTAPCRFELEDVDFLVRIHQPDGDVDALVMEASERFISDMTD